MVMLIVFTVSLRQLSPAGADASDENFPDRYCYFIYQNNPLDVWGHTNQQFASALVNFYQQERLEGEPDTTLVPKKGRVYIPANSPVKLVGYHSDSAIAEIQMLPVMESAPTVFVPSTAIYQVVSSRLASP